VQRVHLIASTSGEVLAVKDGDEPIASSCLRVCDVGGRAVIWVNLGDLWAIFGRVGGKSEIRNSKFEIPSRGSVGGNSEFLIPPSFAMLYVDPRR
jgi:hypothetical protein